MKSFKQFVAEKSNGTYVAVRFSEETNEKLKKYAESIGLTPIDNFHATIVYSESNLNIPYGNKALSGGLVPKELMYLGDVGGDYRALVLKVESAVLQDRFDYYVNEHGYKSRFPEYLQHVSLAYKPPENLNLDDIILPDFTLDISTEYVEKLK